MAFLFDLELHNYYYLLSKIIWQSCIEIIIHINVGWSSKSSQQNNMFNIHFGKIKFMIIWIIYHIRMSCKQRCFGKKIFSSIFWNSFGSSSQNQSWAWRIHGVQTFSVAIISLGKSHGQTHFIFTINIFNRHFHICKVHIWDACGSFGIGAIAQADDITEWEALDWITARDGSNRSPI